MKSFATLYEAISEIERDLSRADQVSVTRVQQQTNLNIRARELLNYSYQIAGGIPQASLELVEIGMKHFSFFKEMDAMEWENWLDAEFFQRITTDASQYSDSPSDFHPALVHCREGDGFSYTYPEIMSGAFEAIRAALVHNPDTRRAYYPFFKDHHGYRASNPTRIPCSLGYQAFIRTIPGLGPHLLLLYSQRSSDFDRFWLSDVWFARAWQMQLLDSLQGEDHFKDLKAGPLMHSIHSLHSFIDDEEIY